MDIIKELGGGKEDAFGFGGVAISSNVYFKAKACKVAMHKGKAFDQGKRRVKISHTMNQMQLDQTWSK